MPKILIVTEKLLTGFDAPILYAMYLDKPMRDHTLLQAIARVNRPYENEAAEMVKPHGFVLDFVGIFDKLEKALAFDSDEINAIVKDIGLLKQLFKAKMETKAPAYLALVGAEIRRQGRRQSHRALPRQGSPEGVLQGVQRDRDALRDHFARCVSAAVHRLLTRRYRRSTPLFATRTRRRSTSIAPFRRKRTSWCKSTSAVASSSKSTDLVKLDANTIDLIKAKDGGDGTKIINLIKSIEKAAEEESGDPFLIALSDRAKAVQENFEDRQANTAEALDELLQEIEHDEQRKQDQAARGLDALTYFVLLQAQR